MHFPGKYALSTNYDFLGWIRENGYVPVEDSPRADDVPIVWYNPDIPPYAFWVPSGRLTADNGKALTASETHAVTYLHRINSIDLIVSDAYPVNAVLVINETDYPGWTVTVNGSPATVKSIAGRLGVRLSPSPNPGEPTYVTFSYQPQSLRTGAIILFITGIIFVGYLLRLDRFSQRTIEF